MRRAGKAGCSQAARNKCDRSSLAAYSRRVRYRDRAHSRVAGAVRCQIEAGWRQSRDSLDEGAIAGDEEQLQEQRQEQRQEQDQQQPEPESSLVQEYWEAGMIDCPRTRENLGFA